LTSASTHVDGFDFKNPEIQCVSVLLTHEVYENMGYGFMTYSDGVKPTEHGMGAITQLSSASYTTSDYMSHWKLPKRFT
jgi:hypothetical protein